MKKRINMIRKNPGRKEEEASEFGSHHQKKGKSEGPDGCTRQFRDSRPHITAQRKERTRKSVLWMKVISLIQGRQKEPGWAVQKRGSREL